MNNPRVLDLYCSAGGVGLALDRLNIPHVGVDIEDYSKQYHGDFIQADASDSDELEEKLRDKYGSVPEFELCWASPPCLAYTPLSNVNASRYNWDETPKERYPTIPELNVRQIVDQFSDEHIIENVSGCDDLLNPTTVNGHSFRLGLDCKHKFETSFPAPDAVATGETVMMQGHTNEREKLAALKEVPETWSINEINSAIPTAYVQYLLHYCPGFDVPAPAKAPPIQQTFGQYERCANE